MAIPQSFIQELLARVDIVEVVGRYVQLKKGGANFMGLCPFHGEKSPSFSVSPTKQFFHCFGCGKHGNAVGFLMEHTGIGFVEAVKDLAQQVGLQVPQEDLSPQERARAAEQRQKQATINDVLDKAAEAYYQQLCRHRHAQDYLKGRGLSGQIAKAFGLGYAPEGWRFLSTVLPDYQSPLLVESGLVIASDEAQPGEAGEARSGKRYDRFRDRIMFPIRNVKGECIGFGGRVLGQGEPKYLNSPETPVFSKGHELYGLFEARSAIRQAGYCLVTEGYMDVVALAQLGFAQAVATLGTACTPDHLRLLLRFTDAVVFSFDGDNAGRRAARKALEAALPWASDTRSIKFLFLPPEHDPDSFIRAHGPDAFAQSVKQAMPLSRFLLEAAASDCDLETAEGRARMAAQAQPLWSAMPDGALKRQLLGEFADAVGLDARELDRLWSAASQRDRARGLPARQPRASAPRPQAEAEADHWSGAAEHSGGPGLSHDTAMRGRQERHGGGLDGGLDGGGRGSGREGGRDGGWRPSRRGGSRGLLGRADRVARIVLGTPEAWNWLSADDHQLLAHEPEPHGALFAWLETQWHEHGPQPWAALREALRGQPFEALALDLNAGGLALQRPEDEEPATESGAALPSTDDLGRELRELMLRLHFEHLKQRQTELIAAAGHDPEALERYRELEPELENLRKALEAGNSSPRV
ncbi:DNA primase [Malikia sp.]|uniref:DNA primase n=1 Tax=Malikia sp. TaxID=2070706 RepID=UPI002609CABC|nr:DNA primase [Malikia sp.]MDD2729672.1 DNA primase [Malikia sp.]